MLFPVKVENGPFWRFKILYADDCNIHVRSEAAGQRAMTSVTEFLEQRLKLKVNRQKSAVGHVSERKFLGHRLLSAGDLGVAPQSQERLKDTLRELTSRSAVQSLPEVIRQVNQKFTGWIQYFRMARMKGLMQDSKSAELCGLMLRNRKRGIVAADVRSFAVRHQGIWVFRCSSGFPTH